MTNNSCCQNQIWNFRDKNISKFELILSPSLKVSVYIWAFIIITKLDLLSQAITFFLSSSRLLLSFCCSSCCLFLVSSLCCSQIFACSCMASIFCSLQWRTCIQHTWYIYRILHELSFHMNLYEPIWNKFRGKASFITFPEQVYTCIKRTTNVRFFLSHDFSPASTCAFYRFPCLYMRFLQVSLPLHALSTGFPTSTCTFYRFPCLYMRFLQVSLPLLKV